MARFRSIHTKAFSDPKIRKVSACGRLLFMYLLINPNRNESGLYSLALEQISFDTGLTEHDVEQAISECTRVGLIDYDWGVEVVWIVNAVKYAHINANVRKSILTDLELCSSEQLREAFAAKWGEKAELQPFLNPIPTPLPHHNPIYNGVPTPPIGLGIGLGNDSLNSEDAGGKVSTLEAIPQPKSQDSAPPPKQSIVVDSPIPLHPEFDDNRYFTKTMQMWRDTKQNGGASNAETAIIRRLCITYGCPAVERAIVLFAKGNYYKIGKLEDHLNPRLPFRLIAGSEGESERKGEVVQPRLRAHRDPV